MNSFPSRLSFLLLLAAAGVFIVVTSAALPVVVAAHFARGGAADGFMPRDAYLTLMLGVGIGLPLFVALLSGIVRPLPAQWINLPERKYWLDPERRAETIATLERQGMRLALLLAAYLCFVHRLVVLANSVRPPRLPMPAFIAGNVLFVLALVAAIVASAMHFRRRR